MKQQYLALFTFFALMSCTTSPRVEKVSKTADGRYELTDAIHYCFYKNDHFTTIKNDSTSIILVTDTCNKCGRVFSEHETTGDQYLKDAIDKNWL